MEYSWQINMMPMPTEMSGRSLTLSQNFLHIANPQHPDKCIVVDLYNKFEAGYCKSTVHNGYKTCRLSEEKINGIPLKEAEEASCESKGLMKEFCIDDVISTGSPLEIAKVSVFCLSTKANENGSQN